MPSRKGPNILGHTSNLVETLVKIQPKAALVLDDLGLTHELTHALPNTMVIHRDYNPQDDRHLRISPQRQIEISLSQYNGQPNLWFYTTNEVGLGKDNLDWHLKLLAGPAHLRWVGLNPAVGTYPDSVEGWGYAEDALRKFSEQRSRFIFGMHEYAGAVPNSGMPDFTNRIQNWDGATFPAYHCGRFQWMDRFCKSKGFQTPRIILTEHGFDDTSDIKTWLNTLRVVPGYHNIRGWKTLVDQWHEWYSHKGWSAQRSMWEAINWLDTNVYNGSPVEAQLVYCWGNNGDPAWLQFDISEATEFIELWQKDAGVNVYPTPTPIPSTEPLPPPAFIANNIYEIDVPGDFVNVRDAKKIPSNIIATVKEGDQVTILAEEKVGKEYWRQIRTKLGITGWVSMQWSASAQKFGVQFKPMSEVIYRMRSTGVDVVNVRKLPTANSPKLWAITPKQIFLSTRRETNSGAEGYWLEIVLPDGNRGWSSQKYLKFIPE